MNRCASAKNILCHSTSGFFSLLKCKKRHKSSDDVKCILRFDGQPLEYDSYPSTKASPLNSEVNGRPSMASSLDRSPSEWTLQDLLLSIVGFNERFGRDDKLKECSPTISSLEWAHPEPTHSISHRSIHPSRQCVQCSAH